MAEQVYLAVDLGASGGRVLAGRFDGRRLALDEVYRFDNGGILAAGTLYWDLLGLWQHVLTGLRAAGQQYGQAIRSVGVDTWGVDFGLLGKHDVLLGNPVHYRDRRTEGMPDRALEIVPREEIFQQTGLQFLPFNTLYQLVAMRWQQSPLLDVAQAFLMMPDLFHWLLTGQKVNEVTDASTTQFLDPRTGQWCRELLERFGLDPGILQPLAQPGTRLGTLRREVVEQTGLEGVEVVLPGTHDTASAVAAVPTVEGPDEHPKWCYISSGTWSLMGAEVPRPVITPRCLALNFTNEGGVGGTIRLLKNISGLWLVQECRRIWRAQGKDWTWDELVARAERSEPLKCFIQPDDPAFLAPQDMPASIQQFCRRTGQPVPDSEGAIIRCALESLAMRYRTVFTWLESLVGNRIEVVHVVGGGSRNRLLCQMTADALDRPVLAGPEEATALGNVMMQAVAWKDVDSIAQGRELIRSSFPLRQYQPQSTDAWAEAYQRYRTCAEGTEPA